MPIHEWKGFVSKDPLSENLITWIFEEDSFSPIVKLRGEKKYSILADHLGTPIEAYADDGNLVWERSLNANGKVLKETGIQNFCPFLYQGQSLDNEIELAYNRFRYYDVEDGRYISQDPIGLLSGEFGFYNYVNNTNLFVDIFGLKKYSQRELDLPEHLRRRPKWSKKTKMDLEAKAKKRNGNYVDIKTDKEITGKKVIGHQKQTWKEYQEANKNNPNLTREQVIKDYNDISNLGYEDAIQSSKDGGTFNGLEN